MYALRGIVIAGCLVAAVATTHPAWGGVSLAELCRLKGPVEVKAVKAELLTGPEVLNHMPGPTAQDFGDMRIATADDGIHPGLTLPPIPGFAPIYGCPNDLAGESAIPTIKCGVPGSPGTHLIHGTDPLVSQESNLHPPDSDQLSLAREGHGSYSFSIATVGQFQSISYLTGSTVSMLANLDGVVAELQVANATLGGTTLVPNVFFRGPFNADLVTVGPGDNLRYGGFKDDETGETIVRGCNGLSLGVDGLDPLGDPIDWHPVSPGPYPKFPDLRTANQGRWVLLSNPDPPNRGRRITMLNDTLVKVPSAAGFFVVQDVPFAGYAFPIDEAEVLVTPLVRRGTENLRDLPDIPGFPNSGKDLAVYIAEVLAPKARAEGFRFVAFLRGTTTVEILGIETFLDVTVAAGGDRARFDICQLIVEPCAF